MGEALVPRRIRHDKQIRLGDGVSAKGNVARSFLDGDSNPRFEPLTFFIDEGDQGNGRFANSSGKFGEIIENFLGNGIQNVVLPEDFQAFLVSPWNRRFHELRRH